MNYINNDVYNKNSELILYENKDMSKYIINNFIITNQNIKKIKLKNIKLIKIEFMEYCNNLEEI
jgi:hypothetical protein